MEKKWYEVWTEWGLVARLMVAVGFAVVAGGFIQTGLLVIEGASENNARLDRDMIEVLNYLAPSVADQALVGDYAAIEQTLKKQVTRTEVLRLWWIDNEGRTLSAADNSDPRTAPAWFSSLVDIDVATDVKVDVIAGGVSYGKLHGQMSPVHAQNRLWKQFVKQLQIVVATLFLMLQFIWLIFRGNLGTLRDLAAGANRFSQGDHAVRIVAEGAPEVRLAADAFNNMANNTETLLASLSQSESKNRLLATIVEQSSEAIWTTDIDGIVTSWNAGAMALFGYTAEEVLGHEIEAGKGDQLSEKERMQRLLKLEQFTYDSKAVNKSGAQFDIQVAVAPLVGAEGQCVGKISVARDVTERNRSEEVLRSAREAAESANHAKSAFLARMSHEIRTPMNSVLGMTELLLETGLTSTQRKYAETVHRSGSNLLGIINDVLDFSKIEAGKLELEQVDLDVRRTLEDVVDMLAERAHVKGLELVCSIPAELPRHLLGDPLRLGQILTNLTGNAIKFTESGSVLISVSCLDDARDFVRLRFAVKDTGPGISHEAQGRIFDEFSQADGSTTRQHGGSGLGLAISKQLVEMMKGGIHVESEPGVGSTFWFTAVLPKQLGMQHAAPSKTPAGTLNGVRALIVESSLVSRGIISSQASNWRMTIRVAESPDQALILLKQGVARGVPFDIVIMDLGFAGGNPLELASAIKAEPAIAKLKVVMLAPVGNHAMIRDAQVAGFDGCLVKPVRQSSLYDALVTAMSGQGMMPEIRSLAGESGGERAVTKSSRPVLLVEDNLINQAVALGMLSNLLGYAVTVANNGKEAIELSAKTQFDLILMDCHMPEMDGYDATRAIRIREASSGAGKRVPIIALTANAMAQDRADCINAGMDDHLGKPFSRQQIQEAIERWLPSEVKVTPAQAARNETPLPLPTEIVLDRRVLRQLSDLQSQEDPDLLARVLSLYLNESPKEMAALAQAVAVAAAVAIRRPAHSLKSSSANIGASAMSQLCADLEAAGRSGKIEGAPALYDKLKAEHDRVQIAVKAELALLGGAL